MAKPKIYQIHYREEQKTHLDEAFIPYNNEGDRDPLLEFNVFRKIYHSPELEKGDLWGALSWKFTQKTGLTGRNLLSFIEENPGFDVYFCNPFPEFESLYQNLWAQGETAHPDFISLNKKVFELIGLPHDPLLEEIQPRSAFSSTNSFVGTPRFWKAYISFVEGILTKINEKGSDALIEKLHCSSADATGVHAGASYFPFIVERLFTVFLQTDEGRKLKAIRYPLNKQDSQMNTHLKHLGEMKDAAWRSKSLWMASCWINYRNLYLTQRRGVKWAKKYLPLITPKKITFADFTSLDD